LALTRPKQAPLHHRQSKPEETSDILLRVVFEMIGQQDLAIFRRQAIQPLPEHIVALVERLWGLCRSVALSTKPPVLHLQMPELFKNWQFLSKKYYATTAGLECALNQEIQHLP
jgi:hypothetical protein